MSSFSSVIQKPGRKIVPKAAPRRNVQRRLANVGTTLQEGLQQENAEHQSISFQPEALLQSSEAGSYGEQVSDGPTTQSSTAQVSGGLIPLIEVNQEVIIPQSEVATDLSLALQRNAQEEVEQSTHDDAVSTIPAQADEAPTIVLPPTNQERRAVREVSSRRRMTPVSDVHTESLSQAIRQSSPEPSSRRSSVSTTTTLTHASPRPRRKRKTTPRAAPQLALSQSMPVSVSVPSSNPAPIASPQPEHHGIVDHNYSIWLRSATQGLTRLSEIAKTISQQSDSATLGPVSTVAEEAGTQSQTDESQAPELQSVKSKRVKRKRTVEQQAVEVVANVMAKNTGGSRQRGLAHENTEEYQLQPSKVRMGELCEDNRLGKTSALETEMQANWAEILQRRKEDRDRALANAEKRRRKGMGQRPLLSVNQEPVAALAPAMAVVNGVIVVDQASREIDRSAQLQQAAVQDLDNVREDRDYYKYVNQGTVGIKPGHGQHSKWDEESTERFFKGLRMFGTDFLMIANMFPGLTRKQIKAKFIREENADKARVRECLLNREPVELEDYAQMANKETEEFQTLESIQKELDEQERQLREEDNQRRKREGFATTTNAEPSERATTEVPNEGGERQTESVEPGRFDAVAAEIVQAAVSSRKRPRKTNTTNSKRGSRGGRRPEGGIEEILGSINEVAV